MALALALQLPPICTPRNRKLGARLLRRVDSSNYSAVALSISQGQSGWPDIRVTNLECLQKSGPRLSSPPIARVRERTPDDGKYGLTLARLISVSDQPLYEP